MIISSFTRFFSAAIVALPLLLAGPAQAATGPGGRLASKPGSPRQAVATTAPVPVAAPVAPAAVATVATPTAVQTVQLKGVVLNPDGRPCAGASVFPAGAPRQLVVTDAQGAFVLPVLAGTAVSLQVEYFGVGSSRVMVDKPAAETLHITLGR